MMKELLDTVVADTKFHVRESADPAVHRTHEHVERVIRPHLERVQQLLGFDEGRTLAKAVDELRLSDALAAQSLQGVIDLVRERGIEGCLRVCLGEED